MLESARLQNFRSHKDLHLSFDSEVTLIIGPNASGKTNIIEAIYMAAQGYSFRGKDIELIMHDTEWARVDIMGQEFSRSVLLEKKETLQKSYIIDDTPLRRLQIGRLLPVVLFEPNNMLLIHGSPELRRAFLDDLLSQTVIGYRSWLLQYKRTLAQRNALLKEGIKRAKSELFAWDIRLCDLGARIAIERYNLIELINEQLKPLYSTIAGKKTNIVAKYQLLFSRDQYGSKMLKQLELNHASDCERGFTSIGPHREDICFEINSKLAEEVASRGETRSLILALKIASTYHLEQSSGKKPLLILDDVFAELDEARQYHLSSSIKQYQKIITTTTTAVKVKGTRVEL